MNELDRVSSLFGENPLIVTFKEKTAIVPKHPRFEEQDVGNLRRVKLHRRPAGKSLKPLCPGMGDR